MKGKNYYFYLHAVLLLWAALFAWSLFFIHDGGKTAGTLAVGNFAFIFLNIPLALRSFVLAAKGRFSQKFTIPIIVMSILNTAMGVNAWAFLILLVFN